MKFSNVTSEKCVRSPHDAESGKCESSIEEAGAGKQGENQFHLVSVSDQAVTCQAVMIKNSTLQLDVFPWCPLWQGSMIGARRGFYDAVLAEFGRRGLTGDVLLRWLAWRLGHDGLEGTRDCLTLFLSSPFIPSYAE